MVAPGTACWATAARVLRELHAALWFLLQRAYNGGSVGKDSTSCDSRGNENVIREKTEKKFAAARDNRQYHVLMFIEGLRSDGELAPNTGVSLDTKSIRRVARKQQGRETIDKTGLQQDSVNRYALRSPNPSGQLERTMRNWTR
ncbi:hypothetical protein NDU88_006331 [Pleurodeles waltl]|uniref:Uncharacterized protein n=1 Tax=Pleurodeles waltl TaxID=8319 RepID=A0AAV7TY74_PLEWA|nr:hypothetical protein NDU88_006331 [Pleurodeles waltl]